MSGTNATSAISGGSSGTPVSSTMGSIAAQKDQFLKLLLAQLKNQDPLSPPDASKFSQEMIQFGQLEQLFNLNTTIDKLGTLDKSTQRTQAVSLIGKQVALDGSTLDYDPAKAAQLGFKLKESVDAVKIKVENQQGEVVRTIEIPKVKAGTHYLPFDGLDTNGQPLAAGNYHVLYEAGQDDNGADLATGIMQGNVDGVDFADDGSILLRVRGQHIPMASILGVQS